MSVPIELDEVEAFTAGQVNADVLMARLARIESQIDGIVRRLDQIASTQRDESNALARVAEAVGEQIRALTNRVNLVQRNIRLIYFAMERDDVLEDGIIDSLDFEETGEHGPFITALDDAAFDN